MQKQQHIPTLTDTISLPFITEFAIAPGRKCIAYVVRAADWMANEYVLTCFVHDIDQNDTVKKSSYFRSHLRKDNCAAEKNKILKSINSPTGKITL